MSPDVPSEQLLLRIGRMPYLNVAPFYFGLTIPGGFRIVTGSPRDLGELARRGEVDTAPFSLCDTFDLCGMEPVDNFAIACRGPVASVCLFSRKKLGELEGALIRVTTETATSVRLLDVLLRLAGVARFRFVRGDEGEADAVLLIGDRALLERQQGRWPVITDLCAEWTNRFGLPFVFARWMIRKDHPVAREFASALGRSLDAGLADVPAVLATGSFALQGDAAHRYLHNFIYRIQDDALAAVTRFREMLREYGIQ